MSDKNLPLVWLKRLSSLQRAAIEDAKRLNIISGGAKSGLTTLGDDLVLTGLLDAGKRNIIYLFPSRKALGDAKFRLAVALRGRIFKESPKSIVVIGGAAIHFISLEDEEFRFAGADLLVMDDAQAADNLMGEWQKDHGIRWLSESGGVQVWLLGHARGANNDFGRLFRDAQSDPSWKWAYLPTIARCPEPEWPGDDVPEPERSEMLVKAQVAADALKTCRTEIDDARAKLEPEEFEQEHMGIVHDIGIVLTTGQAKIGKDETFLQWCDRLAETGLKVDGHPFRLDDRPSMRWIYKQIPSTAEEAFGQRLILMKCAQVGFTVMEMLAMLYFALKWMPSKIGMYLPDQNLARIKSSDRFIPIVRTIPDAHRLLIGDPSGTRKGEGNVMVRNMGDSRFYFLWTSGKGATESVPLDVISFDEVQEMAIADMEKTAERLSASAFRYTLMGSTANWPDRDIHFFYKRGTQHQFWTVCRAKGCGTYQILDDHFPECIKLCDVSAPGEEPRMDYRYVCHNCGSVIEDSQDGEWRPANPDARDISIHYPQFLSPTISPREIIEAYYNADDLKNFFNRKRGKPYLDPTQVPVNLDMLNDCARLGMEMGVEWKQRAKDTFMGIDQMGNFNVVIIAERLPSGHMAVIHVEEIYDEDPFMRCSDLMHQYGVSVCVVEINPNYNDAKRFANRHKGKVFLANYKKIDDGMMHWGDAVPNTLERKTDEEERDRWTVSIDQYKCMQVAMKRIQQRVCVFPDPQGLVQEVREKSLRHVVPVLKDRVFLHFTRTALLAEQDEEEKKFRRRVVKVGIDPHFSYAYMLLNVAWARSHGTTMFLNMDTGPGRNDVAAKVEADMPGLPTGVVDMIQLPDDVCGRCFAFSGGLCTERNLNVGVRDAACPMFIENDDKDD